MPASIRVSWPSASGPQFWTITAGFSEGNLTFAQRASKFTKAKMQATPPTGCVTMEWCASGVAKTEQVCPNAGESSADFIARAAVWIYDQLIEFPATNDCDPPFPP